MEEKNEIMYLCDRKACENCWDMCTHTTDIKHAVNFKKYGNVFCEIINDCDDELGEFKKEQTEENA